MTLFCRLSFLALRRIYHKLYAGCQASVSPLSTIPPHITSTLNRALVSADSIELLKLSVFTNTQQHFLAAIARNNGQLVLPFPVLTRYLTPAPLCNGMLST